MSDFIMNHYGRSDKPAMPDGQTPLRQILEERAKQGIQPQLPQGPNITTPQQITCTVDGYVLKADIMSVIVYTLVKTLGKKASVRKILDQFEFKFTDLTGKQIYPKKAKPSKKKRK